MSEKKVTKAELRSVKVTSENADIHADKRSAGEVIETATLLRDPEFMNRSEQEQIVETAVMLRREYHRRYREANKELIAARKKAWCKANPDKVKEHAKRYWETKAERLLRAAAQNPGNIEIR